MSGLDPHGTTFSDLPPHFEVGMENDEIHDFVYLLYGSLIRQCKEKLNNMSCLLHFAADLAFQSDIFEDDILQDASHFFPRLPMFTDQNFLR